MSLGTRSRNRRIGAAEHHVLARAFQVVVDDLERPRPVPAADGLGVEAQDVPFATDSESMTAVWALFSATQRKQFCFGVAVDVHAIEDQVMGGNLPACSAQLPRCPRFTKAQTFFTLGDDGDLQADQAIVAGPERRADGPVAVGIDDLGHGGACWGRLAPPPSAGRPCWRCGW